MPEKLTKSQAGHLGGISTLAKYGRRHFQDIGIKGTQVTWQRYNLLPIDIGGYAMVNRVTGKIKAIR